MDNRIKKKYTRERNNAKGVSEYDDIWSKKLPSNFIAMREMKYLNMNVSDIASMLYQTDFGDIKNFRALVISKVETTVYIPMNGIWEEQKDDSKLRQLVKRFMTVLEREVIQSIEIFKHDLEDIPEKDRTPDENDQLEFLTQKYMLYAKMYSMLGGSTQDSILKHLIHKIVIDTEQSDFKQENLDKASGYIGFDDGVYSFEEKCLIPNKKAYDLYITQHVGYSYADVENVAEEVYEACNIFLKRLLPGDDVRDWLLRRWNRSAAGIVEKLVLFLHGALGNNGKTKLLELLKHTFGKHYRKCSKKLLNQETGNSAGSANEELSALKNALLAAISEPDATRRLAMSLIKELTGGDGISCRGIYQKKSEFQSKALILIACNDIPEMDSKDEGGFNRIRCVPFFSEFTTDEEKVDETQHIYLADLDIGKHFATWKYAMMKIILEHNEEIPTPEIVMEHTRQYKEREDVLKRFVSDKVVRTDDDKDGVTRKQLWDAFKNWLAEEEETCQLKKSQFREHILRYFPRNKYTLDKRVSPTIRYQDAFIGYKLRPDIETTEDDELEAMV